MRGGGSNYAHGMSIVQGSRGTKKRATTIYAACVFIVGGLFSSQILRRSLRERIVEETGREVQPRECYAMRPGSAVLYRIIGNDIPGRHGPGQTLRNVPFILDNEVEFPGWTKRFVLNRIIDGTLEAELMELLESKGLEYMRIPFEAGTYRKIPLDMECLPSANLLFHSNYTKLPPRRRLRILFALYRSKNNYVMNTNGARNAALQSGKGLAAWTLPWDGNSFLNLDAYEALFLSMKLTRKKYLTVPMVRLQIDEVENIANFSSTLATEEPQIAFHCSSEMEFDENFYYGHRGKAELLQRLEPLSEWEKWRQDPGFGLRCPKSKHRTPEHNTGRMYDTSGWVVRLPSGKERLEVGQEAFVYRDLARVRGVLNYLFTVDSMVNHCNFECLASFDIPTMKKERQQFERRENLLLTSLIELLIKNATESLKRGPYSVVNTTLSSPTGDVHDYFCYTGDMDMSSQKDTALWNRTDVGDLKSNGSNISQKQFWMDDKVSLQQMFHDVAINALAWYYTGDHKFSYHAVRLVEVFFLDERTRMNPHMQFARYPKIEKNSGVSDMKDLHYFLDSIRLLQRSGSFRNPRLQELKGWFHTYLTWLLESKLGQEEKGKEDDQGIQYDLQVASLAFFLQNQIVLMETLARAQSRIPFHFGSSKLTHTGHVQGNEVHITVLNLFAWANLAALAHKLGVPLWLVGRETHEDITSGMLMLHRRLQLQTSSNNADTAHTEANILLHFVPKKYLPRAVQQGRKRKYALDPIFRLDSGIKPFWNLGLREL